MEHRETALTFLREADDRGADDFQGAERMWGAMAHAVIAVCQQRGWRHRCWQTAMGEAVARLADELRAAGDPNMADVLGVGFVIASNYHVHFFITAI